jgi:Helicase HerA, central domain
MADRGSFHIGHVIDPATGTPGSDEVVIGSADLTTHGVVTGMTGSGKTGLAVVLLEEARLAGIPTLVLDPKGDMTNLALVFPDLQPASFRPWVSEADAQAAGVEVDDYAEKQATVWREGLAGSGIGPERLQALKDAGDVTIYTPGSTAGVALNIVGSLEAPSLDWGTDAETLRDEIGGTVTSLLALVGIQADPLSSREHVLLSNLIENAWRAGRNLDLGSLIGEIQTPPIRKLGVFEIDQFFPPADRTKLAFTLNGLIASPTFAAWGEGEPLDPQKLLFTADGKPRCAVIYLAHLSEEERQFVVTLVFSKLVTWMRGQEGTPDLRALAYMDEVFGYLPPTASPPPKKPILTIFKQGRAFGLGLVLSTQNPVDLDYKAMSNAGTWLVGRLQTENDKARVLEGLRSAAGTTDVAELDKEIGGLGKRQFLLVAAKSSTPRLLTTRWAMSYLCGPLTKEQIARLKPVSAPSAPPAPAEVAAASPAAPPGPPAEAADPAPAPPGAELGADETPIPPPVAPGVAVSYLDPAAAWSSAVGAVAGATRLRAFLAARVSLRYDDSAANVDEQEEFEAVYGPLDDGLDLTSETQVDYDDRDFRTEPPAGAAFVLPQATVSEPRFFAQTAKDIQRHLVDRRPLELQRNRALKLVSRPGESPDDFALRCDAAAQQRADAEAAKIRDRLESKRDRLDKALAQAERRVEELDTDTRTRQANELVSGAGAVLGALLGGRRSARSMASALGGAASRRGVTARTSERKRSAEEKVDATKDDLAQLEQEILEDVAQIDERWTATAAEVDTLTIRLEATDVRVLETRLVWVPGT